MPAIQQSLVTERSLKVAFQQKLKCGFYFCVHSKLVSEPCKNVVFVINWILNMIKNPKNTILKHQGSYTYRGHLHESAALTNVRTAYMNKNTEKVHIKQLHNFCALYSKA